MNNEREHNEYGWFKPGPRSYGPLLKCDAVRLLWDSYGEDSKTRVPAIYQLKHFLDFNSLGPEELLELSDDAIKAAIRRAVIKKNSNGTHSAARLMFYTIRRFLELNGRDISFSRNEKKILLKKMPNKIIKQYIPDGEDIYRMVDAYPRKNLTQWLRGKAILLSLWQSGVRAGCLCSWTFGIFQEQLYPLVKVPVRIKVVAKRPEGLYDVAEDTKLSSYAVNYYFTFLHKEAADALREYLDTRMSEGWKPSPSDPVFVTEGNLEITQGSPINPKHVIELVKSAAQQIGIDSSTIWTHCFRKAFRKTLYRAGLDPDVSESLMGHKLPASRGSYFDYHDVSFAEGEYMKAPWERLSVDRFRKLETQIAKTQENGQTKDERISELETKLSDAVQQIRKNDQVVLSMQQFLGRFTEAFVQDGDKVRVDGGKFTEILNELNTDIDKKFQEAYARKKPNTNRINE
jgi:site-specific recombinase XerD